MNARHGVALSAACSTLLATAPISTLFGSWIWAFYAALVIGAVSGAAIAARALRAQLWAQILAMLAALTIMVTWLAHGPHALLGTIPTTGTLRAFGSLLASATDDIAKSGLPVPDTPGLMFLVAAGIGVVAIIVDVFAVALRRPAMAGFPMLAIYAIPVFVHLDSVSPVPFVIGSIGFLWLLVVDNVDRVRRFGRRFTGDGRGLDLWEPSPLAAAGRRLAVTGVVLAVAIPIMVPGMTGGLLSRINGFGSGPGVGSGSGRGASVNLFAELSGKLNTSQQFDMLKVSGNDPDPFYLRFAVADQLTSKGFSSTGPGSGQAVTEGGVPDPAVNQAGVTQKPYHAKVTVLDFSMSYLPVYQRLSRATKGLDGSWLYDAIGNQVYSNRSITTKNKTYEFDYLSTSYEPAALRSAPVIDGQNSYRQYAQVPPDQPAVVKSTVSGLVAGKTNEYDRVLAILRYFSAANGFTYSVSTSKGTSGSDLVDFLTHKQGFCQQYSVAMAWLARAAGIPARVAFGFTRDVRVGDTMTLTNLDLHSWTEIYFPGYGWVPFDPTPTRSGTVRPTWAVDANQPITSPSQTPGSGATGGGTDPGSDSQKGQQAPRDRDPGASSSATAPGPIATWPWWVLGSLVLLVLVMSMPAVRRARLRRRRSTGPSAGQPATDATLDGVGPAPGQMAVVSDPAVAAHEAHQAWDELVDTLVDYAVPVNDTQTPRVLVHDVAGSLALSGPAAEGLRLLGHAEERARYARTPLGAGDLGGALRSVRHAVAATRSRPVRLRAALLPPSVLRRWRERLSSGTVAVSGRISHLQEVVADRLTPRRLLPRRGTR